MEEQGRVLERIHKFIGEHVHQSTILIKLQSNFIEITLRRGCSPANWLHIFRRPFSRNTFVVLLLRNNPIFPFTTLSWALRLWPDDYCREFTCPSNHCIKYARIRSSPTDVFLGKSVTAKTDTFHAVIGILGTLAVKDLCCSFSCGAYSETWQTSKMKRFIKIVADFVC